ncbi:MAG TPA: YggS family pyridoxal phosphate-dependent enzyme [Steroidobacteraceae bacterium]|jgi:pyridoxal phosphate enzyme (YggS family)|nr:YggS family pyridoxal phosphate-dependent enzyme [Steroidobacteraceae bacterium]
MSPQNLSEHIRAVRARMTRAAVQAGRSAQSVTLLAVSKAQPAPMVRAAASCGLGDFGESYLQEALEKLAALRDLPLTWHFVGRLQSNKTGPVAESFAWVHAVDRLKLAERLAAQRPAQAAPLNLCLQVNLAGESSKGGVTPAELPALAAAVASLPRIRLRGLMCIPPEEADPERQRAWFRQLRQLFVALNEGGARLDTLSMGMSGDFEAAILEGATLVRIGTALFGPRPARSANRTGDTGSKDTG